jgi:hypothetical protein
MIRFDSPVARLVLRMTYYAAILIAAWIVANATGAAAPVFIYQGF